MAEEQRTKRTFIELCGLWDERNDKGELYLKGRLGNAHIYVLQNNRKKPNSKEPDWLLMLAQDPVAFHQAQQKPGYIDNDEIKRLA